MTTPRGIVFILYCTFILSFYGCAKLSTASQNVDLAPNEPDPLGVQEGSLVPQTLEAAPRNQAKQKPRTMDPIPALSSPTNVDVPVQPAEEVLKNSPSAQTSTSASPQRMGTLFGEFAGVNTQWEEKKKLLTVQLQEQAQKINELKVKLQLINQVADHVSFLTKASVDERNNFLMEFTIENRAPFAIKDIAITCDQVAPTGAMIRSHAETLYDIIQPATRSTYAPIPYGNKHRQTQSLQCQITNFTVEKTSTDVS